MAYPVAVNFRHVGTEMGLQPVHESSTTQKHPLGTTAVIEDATLGRGTAIYLKGVASTVPGDLVSYDPKTAETVRVTAGNAASVGPVAVALSSNVASQYGWYQIGGSGYVRSATTVADNGAIYLTATAATVDDAVITGSQVSGMRAKAASAAGVPLADLDPSRDWPLRAVRFHGNHAVSTRTLRAALVTKARPWFLPWRPRTLFDPIAFRTDLARLHRLYERRGFWHAAVTADVVVPPGQDTVTVVVPETNTNGPLVMART